MTRRYLVVLVSMCLIAGFAYGEAQRTVFTHENRVPEARQLEVGVGGSFSEFPEDTQRGFKGYDSYAFGPYLRYGLDERFSVNADIPFMYIDRRDGDSDQGLGDVSVGFEFVGWQDVFGYPYILPHATLYLPTGDEDKGMGEGKARPAFGVSIGTTVNDVFHFVVDATYTIYRDRGNEASFGGSLIWDLDEKFSLSAECLVISNRDTGPESNNPIYIIGGMHYEVNDDIQLSVYGGSSHHSEEDVIAGAKASYSF